MSTLGTDFDIDLGYGGMIYGGVEAFILKLIKAFEHLSIFKEEL